VLVNPNSSVVFEVPPLELTPLNLKEVTANEYKIGTPLFPFPERISSVLSAQGEKAIS
jgi:hypothetical protein